jgi:hypothetical protein
MMGNFENVGAERLAYFLVFQQHFLLLLLGVSREQKGNGVVSHPEHDRTIVRVPITELSLVTAVRNQNPAVKVSSSAKILLLQANLIV